MSNMFRIGDAPAFSILLQGIMLESVSIMFCLPSPFRGDKIIELGGGDQPIFHPNLDARKLPEVDIVCDLEKPFPIESGIYDGVYSKFLLEHISWRKMRLHISEMCRILKPNGAAVCVIPNLKAQAKKVSEMAEWDESESALIFASQNCPEDYHRCGFSPEYAIRLFKEAGFRKVKIVPYPCDMEMIVIAHKSSEEPSGKPQYALSMTFYEKMGTSELYKKLASDLQV